jgi:hypothetical protein
VAKRLDEPPNERRWMRRSRFEQATRAATSYRNRRAHQIASRIVVQITSKHFAERDQRPFRADLSQQLNRVVSRRSIRITNRSDLTDPRSRFVSGHTGGIPLR